MGRLRQHQELHHDIRCRIRQGLAGRGVQRPPTTRGLAPGQGIEASCRLSGRSARMPEATSATLSVQLTIPGLDVPPATERPAERLQRAAMRRTSARPTVYVQESMLESLNCREASAPSASVPPVPYGDSLSTMIMRSKEYQALVQAFAESCARHATPSLVVFETTWIPFKEPSTTY